MNNEIEKNSNLDRIVSINAVVGIPIAFVLFAVWCFAGGFYHDKVMADIIYYGLIIYMAVSFIAVLITSFLRAKNNKKKLLGYCLIMFLFISIVVYFIYRIKTI